MVPFPSSPCRSFRRNSPFSKEQASWIVLKYGELKSLTQVRRAFRLHFFRDSNRNVPNLLAFNRLIQRFKVTASVRPAKTPGRAPPPPDEVQKVEQFFTEHPKAHIRLAAKKLGMSFGKVWRILRSALKWKPYRPHLCQVLSPANKQSRLAACQFWLTHDESWFERVLWSDEKWFVLQQAPNRKNTVMWAPENLHKIVECKRTHGKKIMAWVGIVDGKCLQVHWFDGPVDGAAYLEMLQTVVWPAVRHQATRLQYWYQQDSASPHITAPVMEFLRSKFGERIISRNSEHHWPPYSPDLSCLDFSLWSQVMAHVARCEPETIAQLKTVVEDFTRSLDEASLRRMARHTRRRAELCRSVGGGHFEHLP